MASVWRRLLGACGTCSQASSPAKPDSAHCKLASSERAVGKSVTEAFPVGQSTELSTSCSHGVKNNCNTSSSQLGSIGSSVLMIGDTAHLYSSADFSGTKRSLPASHEHASPAYSVHSQDAGTAKLMTMSGQQQAAQANRTASASTARLAVALSSYNIREIAQCDPAMRIRHLTPLSCGSGTAVYKGTWQGLPVAIKFMLYRGGDPAAILHSATALLAAHCVPQRSHVARVYAFDVSEVLAASRDPCSSRASYERAPAASGCGPTDAALPRTQAPGPLTVRPFNGVVEPCCAPYPPSPLSDGGLDDSSGGCSSSGGLGGSGLSTGGGRRAASAPRFHFSSVVFGDTAAAPNASDRTPPPDTAAAYPGCTPQPPGPPGPTLQDLLDHLGARPGDFLVHCVMELASGGNLWYGIHSGVYDMQGPLGPLGALRMLVRSARSVAQGLQQLHQRGDVHGGLTPSNVLLQWTDESGCRRGERSRRTGGEGQRESPPSRRHGVLSARVSDCGMRRLVLGADWHAELQANAELRACTAPELLQPEARGEDALTAVEAAGADCGGGGGRDGGAGAAGRELDWAPSHDVYAFGSMLRCMCWGSQCNDTSVGSGSGGAVLSTWPQHVWPPLRSLGEACMATDPAARPKCNEIIKTLLVLEQRLCYPGRAKDPGGVIARPSQRLQPKPQQQQELGSAGAAKASNGTGDCGRMLQAGALAPLSSSCSAARAHELQVKDGGVGVGLVVEGGGLDAAVVAVVCSLQPSPRDGLTLGSGLRVGMSSMPEELLSACTPTH